ncbi:carbonate dehydratase [Halothiobacillus diazotrophicus]|uniref:Carbonate dehydratase n=1 Tax=Halothiobacillus diazotrophicus TaxID=1860122 RepID=A0A191ZI67_9GAMM|nr:HAD-IC family P-type ATPase [Halothiobacillus diazotrophicus]ANJ67591.1 carbonate dehydratase [Halothiobacillus diazotrophicus]
MTVARSEDETPTPDWHAQTAEAVLHTWSVQANQGLTAEVVAERLEAYGPNRLAAAPPRKAWIRLILQFHNPLIYVLLAAGGVTLLLRDFVDAGVIFSVVVINAIIGYVQEGRAERALDAVRALLTNRAVVLRDGTRQEVDADRLVPGDIVWLEPGGRVPADLRLLQTHSLRINEAVLTGESMPVEKATAPVPAAHAVADRRCMAYAGTVVAVGQGVGVVVATAGRSEMGRIGALMGTVPTLVTPLTRRLDQMARQMTILILLVGFVTFLYGYAVRGLPTLELFLAVVGLAVAAIPEGLPAVVTIVLAIGTRVMARNHAIIRRLPAVETLGSVTVICSDKTGTLTRNQMTVVQAILPEQTLGVTGSGYRPEGTFLLGDLPIDPLRNEGLGALAQCAVLCNDAQLRPGSAADDDWQVVGDPTEGALLTFAQKAGAIASVLTAEFPRVDTVPFDAAHRFMATLHHDQDGHAVVFLKGAPEAVLGRCTQDISGMTLDARDWQRLIHQAALSGERVLALARADMPTGTTQISLADMTPRFTLLGLVGLIDPPREEAIEAVDTCRLAGLQVKMITGDHAVTAAAIGRQLGLGGQTVLTGEQLDLMDDARLRSQVSETDIFARASPEHKLRLVAALQAQGELVAMTGDGVNDAPALKAADIGVAMGQKGTDAAREAADLVLTDDNFATIARAIKEGRAVFDNIQRSLLFMLPTNGGEAGVIMLSVFAGLALPVTPAQILWVNTVTAITLALALAFEPAERRIMLRPPRKPSAPLITRLFALRLIFVSVLMVTATFMVFEWTLARGGSLDAARTAAVNMLVCGELVYLFNVRHFVASAFRRDLFTENPVALLMAVLLIGIQSAFTYAPPLQTVFHTVGLDAVSWAMILGLSFLLFVLVEGEKALLRRRRVMGF